MVFVYLKEFYSETTLGGFREIGKRLPFLDKLIWVTAVSFCCFISIYLILSSWLKFYHDPTIISMSIRPPDETFYLIAVTVCKSNIYNETKLQQTIRRIWGVEPDMDTYNYYEHLVKNITNFSYKRIAAFSHYKDNITLLVGEDFNNLTSEVIQYTMPSVALLYNEEWRYVISDVGVCICLNCFHGKTRDWRNLNITYAEKDDFFIQTRDKNQKRTLIKNLDYNDMVYVHKPSDLPLYDRPQWRMQLTSVSLYVQMRITEADESIEQLQISQRKCRYMHENYLTVFPWYTYEACIMQCRHDLSIKLCGCAPHVYNTPKDKICGLKGLVCLSQYGDLLSDPKKAKGFTCSCLPVCGDIQLKTSLKEQIVYDSRDTRFFENSVLIDHVTYEHNSMVFHHTIVYSQLDMLASFGGTATLFLGFSLLSAVEFVYYFTVRVFVSWTKLAFVCNPKKKKVQKDEVLQSTNIKAPSVKNIVKKTIKDWCEQTSFHAVKYIVYSRRFLVERFLWLLVFLLFLGCCLKMANDISDTFFSKAVVTEAHVSLIYLKSKIPGISICPRLPYENTSAENEFGVKHFGDLNKYYEGMMYPVNSEDIVSVYFGSSYCINNPRCPPLQNVAHILYKNARSIANQQLRCGQMEMAGNRTWSCYMPDKFNSETGPCAVMFSWQISYIYRSLRKFKGSWRIIIEFNPKFKYQFYVHAPTEVPITNQILHEVLMPGKISVKEWLVPLETKAEGRELHELSPEERGCRYMDENPLLVHRVYSYTACISECRAATMQRLCGCIHPMSPNTGNVEICDHSGLKCLQGHIVHLLHLPGDPPKCGCMVDCEGTTFSRVYRHASDETRQAYYDLTIMKPRIEYHRVILQNQLDRFVTVGGILGLFLGASAMTILEIPYFITVRLIVNFYIAVREWRQFKTGFHIRTARK